MAPRRNGHPARDAHEVVHPRDGGTIPQPNVEDRSSPIRLVFKPDDPTGGTSGSSRAATLRGVSRRPRPFDLEVISSSQGFEIKDSLAGLPKGQHLCWSSGRFASTPSGVGRPLTE